MPLQTLDWITLAGYFAIVIGVAWWVIRRQKETAADYFLAGRNLSWWIIGASIFATNIGSEHIVGLAGTGATDGVAMAHYELHAWCLLVLAWIFVPFYARSMVFTMPEFLERRFSHHSRYLLTIVSLISFVVAKIAVGIFAVPTMLGWASKYYVLTSRIWMTLSFSPVNYGLATALSSYLIGIAMLGVFLHKKFLRQRSYVTVTGRGFRPGRLDLRGWRFLAFGFCCFYFLLTLAGPFLITLSASFVPFTWKLTLSLDNYRAIYGYQLFWLALRNTIVVSAAGATAALALATVLSWLIHRTRLPGRGVLDYVVMLPVSLPGIAIAVGVLWTWIQIPIGVYGTLWIIGIGFVGRFVSYGVRSTSANLMQIHPELEGSARVCGASWARTLIRVTLPLIKPGVIAGWVLLFILFFSELSMVMVLGSYNSVMLSMLMFEQWQLGQFTNLAALSMITITVVFGLVMLFRCVMGADFRIQV